MIDDPDSVSEFLGHIEKMGREKNRGPGFPAGFEFFLDDPGIERIEPDHWFIDHDDPGIVQQGTRNGEALPGSVTQVLDPLICIIRERKLLE